MTDPDPNSPDAIAINDLRQQRGVHKRSLTLLENWIRASSSKSSFFELEARLSHLEKVGNSFEYVQQQLEARDPTEREVSDAKPETERQQFEERFIKAKARLMEEKHKHQAEVSFNESGDLSRHILLDTSSPRLPNIELPVFNGDYVEYPAFIDAFMTLVHQNNSPGMTDIRKFGILKKYLGPDVQRTLRYFTLTSENYTACLDALERRYSRKRLIFEKFLTELCRLPVANDTRGLRMIADNTFGILKSVELLATAEEIKDGLLIYLVLQRCDLQTVRSWEEKGSSTTEFPKWSEFMKFLDNRCTTLECVEFAASKIHSKPKASPVKAKLADVGCRLCGSQCIQPDQCKIFMEKKPRDRFTLVKKHKMCVRCLGPKEHEKCEAVCKTCSKAHHVLLHFGNAEQQNVKSNLGDVKGQLDVALLATTRILVAAGDGSLVQCRALLDSGSQVNFITTRMTNLLGLSSTPTSLDVSGIHGPAKAYKRLVEVRFKSCVSDFGGRFAAVVTNQLGGHYPASPVDTTYWDLPSNIKLADPRFSQPAKIDIILSAGVFYRSLAVGQISLGEGKPLIQKTLFGWVLAGALGNTSYPATDSLSAKASVAPELDWLRKFWELEEVPSLKAWSAMEHQCERHFIKNMSRDADGRFIVRLPFSKDPDLLGPSYEFAKSRLVSIEKKLIKNSSHHQAYHDFMQEYEDLGHLKVLGAPELHPTVNLLPHFFVENSNSSTTPLRVVFDASAKTGSGYSLNDLLMVGPALQPDLFSHLIKLRSHQIAVVADVSKMYRQIMVAEEDCKYQCVLWRNSDGRLVVLQLNTVTYGTAPASFIAQRCLKHLADHETGLPLGAEAARKNFLMDDLVTGAEVVDQAAEIFRQTQALLQRGKFSLRKLMSNSPELLAMFDVDDVRSTLEIGDKSVTNTLGLHWSPKDDLFLFRAQSGPGRLTKRGILSETARQFDPLGLIQPVIVIAKIIIQEIWSLKLDWDESVPQAIATQWAEWTKQLAHLNLLSVPRPVLVAKPSVVELHCFADASEKAYAACIYVRSIDAAGQSLARLLCSKSRVAPLKTVSLPRLELCACLLVAELFKSVSEVNSIQVHRTFFWTDSTTALKWVTTSPHRWQTFVATRVTKVQNLTDSGQWLHVPGLLNPADIPSRGVMPVNLGNNSLWWHGPDFLQCSESEWPEVPTLPADEQMPELRVRVLAWSAAVIEDPVAKCKFQGWKQMKRIFGRMARFIYNAQVQSEARRSALLTVEDVEEGLVLMVKFTQRASFSDEIKALQFGKPIARGSPLKSLNPFMDDKGLLRVGGRIENAEGLSFDARHPMLLPKGHPLTRSLFIWQHFRLHHAGPKALLVNIRQRFWPIGGKIEATRTVFGCIVCRRAKPITFQQVMSPLPKERVNAVGRCFQVTGVDFCGPILIHYRGRGNRPTKAYIVIFVCFATKAVHIDVVEDLSTDAFLKALKRFIALRGCPKVIWSDNATNFVGASRELADLRTHFTDQTHWDSVYEWCRDHQRLEWRFIPPRSPHWGGLWEASVKSAKHLLVRTIGKATLTVLELQTLLAEVGAVLNSRPLVPISMDPSDGQPLTPGHFLVGAPLTSLPEPDLADANLSYTKRWKLVTALKQVFWKQWSREYLQTLQQRHKWQKHQTEPKKDEVVLLVDTNLPSQQWIMGRIAELYPSNDGIVRRVLVKTSTGEYERAITQLCPLPLEVEDASTGAGC